MNENISKGEMLLIIILSETANYSRKENPFTWGKIKRMFDILLCRKSSSDFQADFFLLKLSSYVYAWG